MAGIFSGLVFDEKDQVVEYKKVGDEEYYIINDDGFMRHVEAKTIDRAIFKEMTSWVKGHEEVVGKEAAKMMGQDDLFTTAKVINELKNIDQQIDQMMQVGFPEDQKSYMGMMGFKVIIDYHGDLVEVCQASGVVEDE